MQFCINPFTHRLDAFEQDSPGGGDIEWLVGNVGAQVGPNGVSQVNLVGAGAVTVTGVPATNTLTWTIVASGLVWTRDVLAAVALGPDEGHIPTNVGLTTYTLPAISALGTVIEIAGESAGLWRIAQGIGQKIFIGNLNTTTGIGGSVSSTDRYDSIKLICRVVNTTWQAIQTPIGVLNIA